MVKIPVYSILSGVKDDLIGKIFPAPHLVPIFSLGLSITAALSLGKSRRTHLPKHKQGRLGASTRNTNALGIASDYFTRQPVWLAVLFSNINLEWDILMELEPVSSKYLRLQSLQLT